MKLFAGLWAGLVRLLSIATLSPFTLDDHPQVPLGLTKPSSLPHAPLHVEVLPSADPEKGPIFLPPGNQPGNEFKCDYSNMVGWEPCSTAADRTCWLKNPEMGQFDINTDYEALRPHGIVRHYTLHATDGWLNADGQNFTQAKLFNKRYPGPWIQACWGDVLNITVVNRLKYNGTAIHWHGLRQLDTMHMDGVPGVTQCPIAPNHSFSYVINATQYGSSWYHSHYSLQYADGLAGPITIHGPSSAPYDEPAEIPLLMTDWSHWSMFQTDDLKNGTVLLNGRGNITRFGCDAGQGKVQRCSNTIKIPTIETLRFDEELVSEKPFPPRRKRYLLRIINTSFETQFVFSIDNHNLTVVSADFVPIQPYSTHSIMVGIGQRYNVIVEANPIGPNHEGRKDFWIRTGIARCFKHYTDNSKYYIDGYDATGILTYRKGDPETPSSTPWTGIPLDCEDEPATRLVPIVPWVVGPAANSIPAGSTGEQRDVYLNTKPLDPNKTYPLAVFSLERPDHTDFNPLRVDYDNPIFFQLDQPLNHIWPAPWVVIPENFNETDWIYLLIEGDTTSRFTAGAHPIHLHGHDFAILNQSSGAFNPADPLNTCNPARRDVVLLPSNGFVLIAFKADNPGNWLMHCHIAAHASIGLGAQILERQAAANAIWPHPSDGSDDYCGKFGQSAALCRASEVCDKWKDWQSDCTHWWAPEGQDPCANKTDKWHFLPDSGV